MKLCDHIAGIYRNEIEHGNEPLFVSTPSYVQKAATAKVYIIMKNKLQYYDIEGIDEKYETDYHFPSERYYCCTSCMQIISGPVEEEQMEWFRYSKLDKVNEKVVATKDNIYIEDGFYGMSLVPQKELSVVSEINE